MPITQPIALLAENGGAIEGSFFPGVAPADVLARLDAYLLQGRASGIAAGLADPEPAAVAWAYHKAFLAVFLRLSADPASVQLNDAGQRSYMVTQIQNFKDMADEYYSQYSTTLATATVVIAEPASYRIISSFRAPAS